MSQPDAATITAAALQLSEADRLRVASALLGSVDGGGERLADLAAFVRSREMETGKATPESQSAIFKKARAVLG